MARAKERLRAAIADEAREALIERRLALHIQRVVRQLVHHRRDQLHRVPAHRGREQRIAQIAERRERTGRTEKHVEPLLPELLRFAPGACRTEEALVGNHADDRVRPRDLAQLVATTGRQHEQQRIPPHVHIGCVGLPDDESQRIGCEGARRKDELQALAQRRRCRGIGDQLLDRAAPHHQAGFFDAGPGDVARVGTEEQHEDDGGDGGTEGDDDNTLQEAAPAGSSPLG